MLASESLGRLQCTEACSCWFQRCTQQSHHPVSILHVHRRDHPYTNI